MIPQVVFCQPRGTAQSWPSDPVTSSEADAGTAPIAPPVPGPTQGPGDDGGGWTGPQSGSYLSQEMCQQASNTSLLTSGGYALGAALLAVTFFAIARKRLWWASFTRYAGAVTAAGAVAFLLVVLDPAQGETLTRCLDPAQGFVQYVFLGGTTLGRAILLGLLPASALAFLGCYFTNRT